MVMLATMHTGFVAAAVAKKHVMKAIVMRIRIGATDANAITLVMQLAIVANVKMAKPDATVRNPKSAL